MATGRQKQKAPARDYYPFIASELEKASLGDLYNPSKSFAYQEDEIEGCGPITEENHNLDLALKLARIQEALEQEPSAAPQIPTYAGGQMLKATPEAIQQFFAKDPSAIIDELAGQLIARHAERQQLHMYRRIAADALAEGDNWHRTAVEERQASTKAQEEIIELKNQLNKLRSQASPPAPVEPTPNTRRRVTRFPILPQTPHSSFINAESPSPGPSRSDSAELDPYTGASPFTPATPLATPATRSNGGKTRSARFPDPPLLKDGKEVTFDQWRDGLEDKIRANHDWFEGASEQATQDNIVSFMRTRTEGTANQSLSTLIRTVRESNQPVSYQYMMDRLERTYGDPHKALNARRDFQKLYLRDPANFATFQGDFFRLAQERRLPADQWVEEFHEKLPDALRTQMGIYRRQYIDRYDDYVDLAQDLARELALSSSRTGDRPSRRARDTEIRSSTKQHEAALTAPTAPTAPVKPATAREETCFRCRKPGHRAHDCPQPRGESKVLETPADNDNLEPSEEELSGEDSL